MEKNSNFYQACMSYPVIVLLIDPSNGNIIAANSMAEKTYHYSIEELESMNISDINMLNKEDVNEELLSAKKKGRHFFHFPHKTKEGELIEMEVYSQSVLIDDKKIVMSHITPFSKNRYINQGAIKFVEEAEESVVSLDHSMRIIGANKSFQNTFGFDQKHLIGTRPRDLFNYSELAKSDKFCQTLEKGQISKANIKLLNFQNVLLDFEITGVPVFQTNNFFGAVVSFKDITLLNKRSRRLKHLAYYDSLTDLHNRVFFIQSAKQLMTSCKNNGKKFALIYSDLDRFKAVNDTHGHVSGDLVLKRVAKCLHKGIGRKDNIARIGGDEFVALLQKDEHISKIDELSQSLESLISSPYIVDGKDLSVGASFGYSIYPDDGITVDELLNKADSRMYKKKQAKKDLINSASHK